MAYIYALLNPDADEASVRGFSDVILDNAGRLVALVSPELAIVDGDETTAAALRGMGDGVILALGVEEVASLAAAVALTRPDLLPMIAALALTTTASTTALDKVRRFNGEVWPTFGCTLE